MCIHIYTYIYTYIYICMGMCICVYMTYRRPRSAPRGGRRLTRRPCLPRRLTICIYIYIYIYIHTDTYMCVYI